METQDCFQLGVELARQAGEIIKEAIYRPKVSNSKSNSVDIVTETDKKCEETIIEAIKARYPDHKFIAEESYSGDGKYDYTDDPTWFIDPIDGTTNFVQGLPFVCVSIALAVHRNLVFGIVYNPVLNEMFTAIQGQGAFLNNSPIQVSEAVPFGRAVVLTEFGYDRSADGVHKNVSRIESLLLQQVRAVRSFGSAALNMCYVACGRAHIYYEGKDSSMGPKPWDFAAGWVILKEAGGALSDLVPNQPFDFTSGRVLVANNASMIEQVFTLNHFN